MTSTKSQDSASAEKQTTELLKQIKTIEAAEQSLANTLAKSIHDPQANSVINNLDYHAKNRINLFKQLQNINTELNEDISTRKAQLQAHQGLSNNFTSHLTDFKSNINNSKNNDIKNLRLSQINTYYTERYKAFFTIFRNIVYICLCIMIVVLLRQRYLLSGHVANILGMILMFIGLIFIIPPLFDINSRNNLVFDEYDFDFNAEHPDTGDSDFGSIVSVDGHSLESEFKQLGLDSEKDFDKYKNEFEDIIKYGECVGSDCCSIGAEYDKKKAKCVVSQKESFLSGQSTSNMHPGASLDSSPQHLVSEPLSEYYSIH